MSGCRVFYPLARPDSKGCAVCGGERDAHPFIAGRPESPFDPCPEIPNATYPREGEQ
jgi:hypothetical protein